MKVEWNASTTGLYRLALIATFLFLQQEKSETRLCPPLLFGGGDNINYFTKEMCTFHWCIFVCKNPEEKKYELDERNNLRRMLASVGVPII